ncbi:MAG: cache domain-containing protein [Planctomycetota bacterium]
MIRSLKIRFVLFGIGLTWLVGGAVATVAWFRISAAIQEEAAARVEDDARTIRRLFFDPGRYPGPFHPLPDEDLPHVKMIAARARPGVPAVGCVMTPDVGLALVVARTDGDRPEVFIHPLRHHPAGVDRLRDLVYPPDPDSTNDSRPTVTIFEGRTRIATNVRTETGERAVGTLVSDPVAEAVLGRGEVWNDRAWVVSRWVVSCYLPIHDPDGGVIGMLYAGLDEEPYVAEGRRSLLWFLLTVLGITGVTSILAAWVAAGLARPLLRLTAAAGALGEGRYERIDRDEYASHELLALTEAFNLMIERVLERTVELEKSRGEARQALSDYLDVLAFVAHELRHPVAGAQAKLTLVEKGYLGEVPEKMAPALVRIRRYLEYGLEISESFNYLSRAESHGFEPVDRELEDVRNELVMPVVADWEDAAADRRMELRVAGEGASFVLDPDLARIALGNLVGNALKYGEKGSPVDVEVEVSDGALRLSVTNRGVGIPEECYDELFGKFGRLNDSRLEDRRGTGIGLFLVKRMLEAHGGDVEVEGEYGRWITFRLVFPAGRSAVSPEEPSAAPQSGDPE